MNIGIYIIQGHTGRVTDFYSFPFTPGRSGLPNRAADEWRSDGNVAVDTSMTQAEKCLGSGVRDAIILLAAFLWLC